MGTPSIAASCLKTLIECNQEIVGVICQPDKQINRKKEIVYSPVKQIALEHNLKLFQPNKINEIYDDIVQLKPDLILTCAYGQFVSENILKLPQYGAVNIHASLLPKYRGGAPIQYAILNGDTTTGITLMYMVKKMDAGNIIKKYDIEINDNETYFSLKNKLTKLASEIIIKEIDYLCSNKVNSIPQNENEVSFAPIITRNDEHINWNDLAINIDRRIRALYDKPLAYSIIDNQPVKIIEAVISNIDCKDHVPGIIVEFSKNGMFVTTKDYLMNIQKIQLPSKKPTYVKDLINGNSIIKINKKLQ